MTLKESVQLQRTTPEAQGVSAAAIAAFVDAANRTLSHLHSVMLLRHGAVIAEGWWSPYVPEQPHMLFSLSKSFTSTAVGLAVDEGRLTVEDRVIDYFPEDLPETVSENLAAMRVRHLLAMVTGHETDTTGPLWQQEDGNWAAAFLAQPVERTPGSYFLYNSGATYMLSAIVQKLTGQTLLDYLTPRLFQPLGIENPTWESCPRGINTGGWGLSIRTEDIARFGQLYLQQGVWQGEHLIPATWVTEATSLHSDNSRNENPDWAQGYGYQFWRCRHNAYRGDGAFGQFCIVIPEHDAVVAITSGLPNMQAVLDLIWEHLLPAFGSTALPEEPDAQQSLTSRLSTLALPLQSGAATSPVAGRVSGTVYDMDANEAQITQVSLNFAESEAQFRVRDESGDHQVTCGHNELVYGVVEMGRRGPLQVAASGGWTADDTYSLKLYFYNTPFSRSYTCRFEDDGGITVTIEQNVDFGPTKQAALTGKAVRLTRFGYSESTAVVRLSRSTLTHSVRQHEQRAWRDESLPGGGHTYLR